MHACMYKRGLNEISSQHKMISQAKLQVNLTISVCRFRRALYASATVQVCPGKNIRCSSIALHAYAPACLMHYFRSQHLQDSKLRAYRGGPTQITNAISATH